MTPPRSTPSSAAWSAWWPRPRPCSPPGSPSRATGRPRATGPRPACWPTLEGGSAGQARRTLEAGRRLVGLPGHRGGAAQGHACRGPSWPRSPGPPPSTPPARARLLAGSEAEPLHVVKERCQRVRATCGGPGPGGHPGPDPRRADLHLLDRRRGGVLLLGTRQCRAGGEAAGPAGARGRPPAQRQAGGSRRGRPPPAAGRRVPAAGRRSRWPGHRRRHRSPRRPCGPMPSSCWSTGTEARRPPTGARPAVTTGRPPAPPTPPTPPTSDRRHRRPGPADPADLGSADDLVARPAPGHRHRPGGPRRPAPGTGPARGAVRAGRPRAGARSPVVAEPGGRRLPGLRVHRGRRHPGRRPPGTDHQRPPAHRPGPAGPPLRGARAAGWPTPWRSTTSTPSSRRAHRARQPGPAVSPPPPDEDLRGLDPGADRARPTRTRAGPSPPCRPSARSPTSGSTGHRTRCRGSEREA